MLAPRLFINRVGTVRAFSGLAISNVPAVNLPNTAAVVTFDS